MKAQVLLRRMSNLTWAKFLLIFLFFLLFIFFFIFSSCYFFLSFFSFLFFLFSFSSSLKKFSVSHF